MISVCIPVWNREKFIGETIESVLNQTYKDFEIVIVDDGSTDNTVKIIEGYKDDRIRLIKKKHTGATDSYNQTLKEARGDVICILGSDDLWLPTKLEEQIKVADKYPYCILHTKGYEINERSELIGEVGVLDTTFEGYYERAKQPWAWFLTSSWFVPKKIFDKVGLFPDSFCQDYHWMLKAILLHKVKMKMVPKLLIMKRTIPNSNTTGNIDLIHKDAERIRKEVLKQLDER